MPSLNFKRIPRKARTNFLRAVFKTVYYFSNYVLTSNRSDNFWDKRVLSSVITNIFTVFYLRRSPVKIPKLFVKSEKIRFGVLIIRPILFEFLNPTHYVIRSRVLDNFSWSLFILILLTSY